MSVMAKLLLVYSVDDKVCIESCLPYSEVNALGGLAFNARYALEERKGKDQTALVVKVDGEHMYKTSKLLSALAQGSL